MLYCKVLIVDDEPAIRNGLKHILEAHGATIAGEADNGASGVEEARKRLPEIILLDVSMPIMDGFAAAREIRQHMPALHIIFISQHGDRIYAEEAFALGAAGYILKQFAGSDLPKAIQAVMSGQTFISPAMTAYR